MPRPVSEYCQLIVHSLTHSTMNQDASTTTGEDLFISSINVKLPAFWQSDPPLWFMQIESIFRKNRISKQSTMFDYVVAELQPETMHEVRDIISNPDKLTPYDTLKRELLNRVSLSEHKRLQQLLNDVQLGDRRPSQLLRHMRSLLGDKPTDECLLKQLFIQRLPSPVQVALSLVPGQCLDNLAASADKVMEVMPSGGRDGFLRVSSTSEESSSLMSLLREQQQQMQQMQYQLNQLTMQSHRSRERPTTHPRPRSRSFRRSPSPTRKPNNICFYHRKFGSEAFRCTSPCAFPTSLHHSGNGSSS